MATQQSYLVQFFGEVTRKGNGEHPHRTTLVLTRSHPFPQFEQDSADPVLWLKVPSEQGMPIFGKVIWGIDVDALISLQDEFEGHQLGQLVSTIVGRRSVGSHHLKSQIIFFSIKLVQPISRDIFFLQTLICHSVAELQNSASQVLNQKKTSAIIPNISPDIRTGGYISQIISFRTRRSRKDSATDTQVGSADLAIDAERRSGSQLVTIFDLSVSEA